jgi:O-antigen/teichoic acid export membrane protein
MTLPEHPAPPEASSSVTSHLTRREIIQHITMVFSGSAVAQGVTALALLAIARRLGADHYGQYAACFTLASFASIVYHLGLDSWLLREGGRTPERLGKLAGSVIAIRGIGGAVWLVGMTVLALLLNASSEIFRQRLPAGVLILSALVVWLDCLLAATLVTFRAAFRNKIGSPIEAGVDTLWLAITVLLIAAGEPRAGAYLAARAVVLLAGLAVSTRLLRNYVRLQPDRETAWQIVRASPPFASADFLAWSLARLDVLIVTFALGERAVGVYSPAVSLVSALFMVPYAVYGVMVPVLSRLYPHRPRQFRLTTLRMLFLLLAIGVGLAGLTTLGTPLVIAVLGKSFGETLVILRILSILLIFKCPNMGVAAVIIVTGKQAKRVGVQIVAVLFNLLLNLAVVYRFGIRGVAVVYVLTELLLLAGYSWVAMRKESSLALANPDQG